MKPGRNDPCSCGSGKKFKHCCEGKDTPHTLKPSPTSIDPLIALYSAGLYAELESRARVLVGQFPDFGFGWKLLGGALQMQGKDALPAFHKTVQLLTDDAEAHYNLGIVLKSRGLLADALASFRRVNELKPGFAQAHINLGNILKELRQLDSAVTSYRRALEIEPNNAEVHNNLGNALKDLGQLEDAVASFRRALQLKPDYTEAHGNLGIALRGLGQLEDAVASCRRATELKPDFAEAHNNLGIVLRDIGQFDAALESYHRALELKPEFADVHRNLGIVLKDLGKLEAALASYRIAVRLKPDFAEAHSGLGLTLLLTGQFSEGWKEYWWGINTQGRLNYPLRPLSDNPIFKRRPDELLPANLQGMQIAILKDQGLGDELFFLRFAKELQNRGARVVYVADPRLASFIRRAKWVDYVAEKGEPIGESHAVLFVSELPLVLGMATEADIPLPVPLEVMPIKRQEIALRLAHQRKTMQPLIGITWRAGGDKLKKRMSREIPLEQLAAALRGKQATFIVVQRNPQPGEIAAFEAALGQSVLDFSDLNDDLEGMLALMEQLDDYIGVDNTNMHLRTGVGKSARMLVPHLEDFRCMAIGNRSPWFPGYTIYRRTTDYGWDNALEQLICDLNNHSPAGTVQSLNGIS
jgi:tetratricopeptide (TPR) repeat protein